jgi:pyruvate kinase
VLELLKKNNLIAKGDVVVNTGSMPIVRQGKTNMLKLSVVD